MNKILVICGPTATGKTALGLELAEIFQGDLISADSRQIYTGMDIGTGKDIPQGAKKRTTKLSFRSSSITYYQTGKTKIWGYDVINPDLDYSAAQYYNYVWSIIPQVWNNKRLPILVGGTGHYIDAVTHPPETLGIPRSPDIRADLSSRSVNQLQQQLEELDPTKFESMNNSDKNNPRRLIRAIEVSLSRSKGDSSQSSNPEHNPLCIGLSLPLDTLDQKIEERVHQRATDKFTQEISNLEKKYTFDRNQPAFSATGYLEWHQHIHGQISKRVAVRNWITREKQYARRQLTWFKKYQNINWFDISQPNWQKQVVDLVKSWYA